MNDQSPGGDGGTLEDSDRKLLERVKRDETQRHVSMISGLIIGGLFLWLNWEAPFAYNELKKLPYSEASKSPYYETIHMVPWFIGLLMIARGIHDCFFNRRRKLLIKLAAMIEPDRYPKKPDSPADF